MKKKSASKSAFFNLRVLIGLFIALAGISLALVGLDAFTANRASNAPAQQDPKSSTSQGFLLDLTVRRFTSLASTRWRALNGDSS